MRNAVRADRKTEPAQREIAPDHKRADGADQRAGRDVGRIMRSHDHAADGDQQRIDQQHRPGARPQHAERHQHRKCRGRMAGRQAGVIGAPDERAEDVRVGRAGHKGPRAADQALDDGDEQARHADGQEQEADPHHERGDDALSGARQHRRQGSEREKQQPQRPQEPAGLAVVGDRVEGRDQPARQLAGGAARGGVAQDHDCHEQRARHHSGDDEMPYRQQPPLGGTNTRRPRQPRHRRHDVVRATPPGRRRALYSLLRAIGHGHGFSTERNTVRTTGLPMVMLKPSMRWLSV